MKEGDRFASLGFGFIGAKTIIHPALKERLGQGAREAVSDLRSLERYTSLRSPDDVSRPAA